jgi:hypothetical protein
MTYLFTPELEAEGDALYAEMQRGVSKKRWKQIEARFQEFGRMTVLHTAILEAVDGMDGDWQGRPIGEAVGEIRRRALGAMRKDAARRGFPPEMFEGEFTDEYIEGALGELGLVYSLQ